jgi:hypothetical protein
MFAALAVQSTLHLLFNIFTTAFIINQSARRTVLCCNYFFRCFKALLKASLLSACSIESGRWFHGSETLTANEYFLMSVRAYCVVSPCTVVACLVLAPFWFVLNLKIFSPPSFIFLNTSAISWFCRLSSSVSRPSP